ncbi:DUF5694 domain-containing protein, partial [Staphylococcus aureus]|uniref:DUF5694 domain-containing protein n=1 Tax=Staphylococcus aureus TaxID=1280 RepID=UPI0018EC65CA
LNINIYCIDQNYKEKRKKLQKCAEKILEYSDIELYQYIQKMKTTHQELKNKTKSILNTTLNQTKSAIPLEKYLYSLMQAEDVGLELANHWSHRNYIMAINIIEATKKYNTAMVFIGKSHSRYLKYILESTGLFKVFII